MCDCDCHVPDCIIINHTVLCQACGNPVRDYERMIQKAVAVPMRTQRQKQMVVELENRVS